MLKFRYKNEVIGKIEFDDCRRDFDALRESFKVENTAARFVKSARYMQPFMYPISSLGQYSIGMTQTFMRRCDRMGIPYEADQELLDAIRPSLETGDILPVPNGKFKYRDYQFELIGKLCENGRGVIVSPTRSGKSLIIAGLIHNIFQNVMDFRIQNVLILVPNVQLVYQFFDDLNEYGLGGIYHIQMFTAKTMAKAGAKVEVDKLNVYITNAQYLLIHGDELPETDMVFMDECHMCSKGAEISKLIKSISIRHKFGCTGTLPKDTANQWMIEGVFGPVLDEIEIKKLQEDKILANVKVYPIRFVHRRKVSFRDAQTDENGVQEDAYTAAKKAYQRESMYLGTHPETVGIEINMCRRLIQEHPDWNFLVLFDFTEQGRLLYKSLDFSRKFFIDGSIDVKVRREIVSEMDSSGGNITIAQSKTFSTGLTISRINCIMILTNQSSCTKIIQSIGRGLRRQNKTTVLVFDVSHNYAYSSKHFMERTNLYEEFYGLRLNRDYTVKDIPVSDGGEAARRMTACLAMYGADGWG